MIYFENRESAGKALAKRIADLGPENPVVMGVAAGGIEVAKQVANELGVPLDVIIAKKLYYPEEPESIMGAITEDGNYYISENARVNYSDKVLVKIVERSRKELEARKSVFREHREFPDLKDRIAIIVDEGIINGAAVMPLVDACRSREANAVWLASPMAGEGTCLWLANRVDELVILEKPKLWQRIEDGYRSYRKLPKDELLKMLG